MKPTDNQMKWLAVDFDETVAKTSGFPDYTLLHPVEGAKQALDELVANGWKIIIYTARPWSSHWMIEDFLNENKIPFKRIECGKLLARKYIDDRNVEFDNNWKQIVERIKKEPLT